MTVMMFGYRHGGGGWGWLAMSAVTVVVWVLVLGAGTLLFRALVRDRHRTAQRPAPEMLPAERFARGEIDDEEYQRHLTVLHATPPFPKRP